MSVTTETSERSQKILDVFAVFSAAEIVDAYPDPSSDPDFPTEVDGKYVHTVSPGVEFTRLSGNEVYLGLQPGDFARWRETAPELGTQYSALLYRCDIDGEFVDEFDPLVHLARQPHPGDVSARSEDFTTDVVKSHAWGMHVTGTGTGDFRFRFQIIEGSDKAVGYFCWPARITFLGDPGPA